MSWVVLATVCSLVFEVVLVSLWWESGVCQCVDVVRYACVCVRGCVCDWSVGSD